MSSDNTSPDSEPHPLRDEPLPVCIPAGVARCPREWYLNDGNPPPTGRIHPRDIYVFESPLEDFVGLSQVVLLYLINNLTEGRDVVSCNGRSIPFMKFFHLAKYGSKRDTSLQEDALGVIKEAAEKHNLTLGEVKTLFYVASRHAFPALLVGPEVFEVRKVQRWRELLNAGNFTGGLAAFDWGGDLKQFKPILEKALEYYEKVVMPDWCFEY